MSSSVDALLDLPGITVESCLEVEGYVCIQVNVLAAGIECPHCQKFTSELNQVRSILVRDLSTFGKPVYLKVPRRQFYCRKCQRYSTEKLEFVQERRLHTQRYEQSIYQRVQSSSIEQISREENLNSEEIQGIFTYISNQLKKKTGSQ